MRRFIAVLTLAFVACGGQGTVTENPPEGSWKIVCLEGRQYISYDRGIAPHYHSDGRTVRSC